MTTNVRLQVLFAGVVPKGGEAPEDTEDAVAFNEQNYRYAISDGVGQSFFAGIWSKLLANRFVYDGDAANRSLLIDRAWQSWLEPIREKWAREVEERISRSGRRYYLQSGTQYAAATFVGLEITPESMEWKALAIGDTCLFQFGKIGSRVHFKTVLPIEHPDQFDNYPPYVASVAGQNRHMPRFFHGKCKQGDLFLLATDALSTWLLANIQADVAPGARNPDWYSFLNIRDWAGFYSAVQKARAQSVGRLEDDDTAMVLLLIDQSQPRFVMPPGIRHDPSVEGLEPDFASDPKHDVPQLPSGYMNESEIPTQTSSRKSTKAPQPIERGELRPLDIRRADTPRLKNRFGTTIAWLALLTALVSLAISIYSFQKDDKSMSQIDGHTLVPSATYDAPDIDAEPQELPAATPLPGSVPQIDDTEARTVTAVPMGLRKAQ